MAGALPLISKSELNSVQVGVGGGENNETPGMSLGSPTSPRILDFSYNSMESEDLDEALTNQPVKVYSTVEILIATNNSLLTIPNVISSYENLRNLDLSVNQLTSLPESLTHLIHLTTLIARNNLLDDESFPKNFKNLCNLRELNLSGNNLTLVPMEIVNLTSLVSLHLGGNRIGTLPREIRRLRKLEVLYLGGNVLTDIPLEVGELTQLKVFVLCENLLESIPSTVRNLKQLKSLSLHRNRITVLPIEIIKLRNLMELSLRDNPLVVQFVREMIYDPPSLMELAGRTIKTQRIPYNKAEIPKTLNDYLHCAHMCVNPRCKGVYFDTCVEHIKFVDFCGKYRVPLLQYLCSPKCSSQQPVYATSDSDSEEDKIKKVLLG